MESEALLNDASGAWPLWLGGGQAGWCISVCLC